MKANTTLNKKDFSESQWRFLKSKSPFVLFCGGYGSGKSVALCFKLLQLKIANGTLPGLLIAQTYASLFTNLVDPLLAILSRSWDPELMPVVMGRNSSNPHLLWPDGTPTYIRSAENLKSYEGLTVGYLLGDEVRLWSRQAYEVAIARVRIKNAPFIQRAFSSTPEMNWMGDEFNSDKPNRELIQCGTEENMRNLPSDYIENLALSYSPRMQQAVLKGQFCVLEGAVFEQFDPYSKNSPWVVDYFPSKRDLERFRVYLAIDPGWRRSAYLFAIEIRPLDWIVFDECMLDNTSEMDAVQIVNNKEYPIDEIWADPAAAAHQSVMGWTITKALCDIKTRTIHETALRLISQTYRDIAWATDKLRVLLGGYEGYPIRIRFSRSLIDYEKTKGRGIVKDLSAIRYPDVKDGRPISDIPLDDGVTSHSYDALKYFAVGRWLCEERLRTTDPRLLKDKSLGYRIES